MRASPSGPSWLAVVALQATAIASRPVRDAVAAQGPKEPSPTSCVSISSSGTNEWCQTNCKVGVCPKGVCKCGDAFVTLKHTGCDLEAQGCIDTGNEAFPDCRTCAAHMEQCMVVPQLNKDLTIKTVTAEMCVEQVSKTADGCGDCNSKDGKLAFKTRVGEAASEGDNWRGESTTTGSSWRDVKVKAKADACDLEVQGCIDTGNNAAQDCRTCAAHMELCIISPKVDENGVVQVVTADDCVEQVAAQAKACSTCNTTDAKKAFRFRIGDSMANNAGVAAAAEHAATATNSAVTAANAAAAAAAANRSAATVDNATRAADEIFEEAAKAHNDEVQAKAGAFEDAMEAAGGRGFLRPPPPAPPFNANICDFDTKGCIAMGPTADCRTCAAHITNCMATTHRDANNTILESKVESCVTEVAIRAEGCAKCGNADSIEAYKFKVGAMPSPPSLPPMPPPPTPPPLPPPLPPSPPPPPPTPPPPSPSPTPPPKSSATKAAEEYAKLDRWWGVLKQQRKMMEELSHQAHDKRTQAEEDYRAARDAVDALKKAHTTGDALAQARAWVTEAMDKVRDLKIKDAEAKIKADGARDSEVKALEARNLQKQVAEEAAQQAEEGLTDTEIAAKKAAAKEAEAHGVTSKDIDEEMKRKADEEEKRAAERAREQAREERRRADEAAARAKDIDTARAEEEKRKSKATTEQDEEPQALLYRTL